MKFEETFPVWYHAFAHGETALLMERSGGICDLALEDVEYVDGVPLPDNFHWPIFSRNGGSSGNRPLMGSGIRFLNLSEDGAVDYVAPDAPEIFPWGMKDRNMALFIDRKRVFWQVRRPPRTGSKLRLCVNESYLFRGESHCIKCHRNDPFGVANSQYVGRPLNPAVPLPNGKATRSVRPGEIKANCLVFHETLHLPYRDKELYFAFYGGEEVAFPADPILRFMDFAWTDKARQTVVLAFAENEEDAIANAKAALPEADALLRRKLRHDANLARHAATVSMKGKPEVAEFFREQSRYLQALQVADGIGIRAAAFKFSYFAMWDAIFPIRDILRNGELAQAKKMFRYLLGYPNMEFFPWGAMHLVLMLEEMLSYERDEALLREAWPTLKQFLANIEKMTDKTTGLYSDLVNCAVDVSAELGLSGRHYAVCMNSFYYNALRTMENFAEELGEDASLYHAAWRKLEKHFMQKFYNASDGFVRLALDERLNPASVEVLMNTSVIGLEFPFGEQLFADQIPAMSHFMATRMKHPLGYSAVPYNSPLPCDMWRNVHMNQHLGHESKLARLADNVGEVKRILTPYLAKFAKYGVAVETYNLAGCYYDESQVANWQTFSATAAATAMISGLCGIFHHGGGYTYDPASGSDELELENFFWRGKKLKIRIRGKGQYASSQFNGKALNGTLQLPADLPLKAENEWVITRTVQPPVAPVLISTHGMPVAELTATENVVAFTAKRSGSYPIKWLGSEKGQIFINGTFAASGKFPDVTLHIGDRVELKRV